jgi:hypothetical protein
MAGIEADVDLGPLHVVASLAAELGRQNDLNEKRYQEMRRRNQLRTQVPIDYKPKANCLIPASGNPTAMGFGGPEAGFYWLVRRLVVGGLTWGTSAAGTAEVYVTASESIAVLRGLTDLVDEASGATPAIPSVAFYTGHQIKLEPREKLYVVIVGGTPAQQYAGNAQIEVHRQVAAGEEFEA